MVLSAGLAVPGCSMVKIDEKALHKFADGRRTRYQLAPIVGQTTGRAALLCDKSVGGAREKMYLLPSSYLVKENQQLAADGLFVSNMFSIRLSAFLSLP